MCAGVRNILWKWIEREPDALLRSRENQRKYRKLPLVSLRASNAS